MLLRSKGAVVSEDTAPRKSFASRIGAICNALAARASASVSSGGASGGGRFRAVSALALVAVLLLLLGDSGSFMANAVGQGTVAEGVPGEPGPGLEPAPRSVAVLDTSSRGSRVPPPSPRKAAQVDSVALAQAAAAAAAASLAAGAPPPSQPPLPASPLAPAAAGRLGCNVNASTGGDARLPPLSRQLLDAYSAPLPPPDGTDDPSPGKRVLIASFTDWKPSGSASQKTQALLTANWVNTLAQRALSCLVGICEATAPLVSDLATLIVPGGCALFHAPRPECVTNPRVGRWYYASEFMALGFDVFSSDPDIVLFRDPLPYFSALMAGHPLLDVLTSSDSNNGVYTHHGGGGGGGGGGDGGVAGGVTSVDGQTFLSLTPVSRLASDSAQPVTPRWSASFPELQFPTGYVRRAELRGLEQGVDEFLDALASGRFDVGLDNPGNCNPHQFNSGMMYWRSTPRAAALAARWRAVLDKVSANPTADDQLPFNQVAKNGSALCATGGQQWSALSAGACGGDRLLNGVAGGTACLGILSLVQFANGFMYTASRAHEQHRVVPYAFHATYSGDKVLKLREEGVFHDPPAYYDDGATLYLSYEVDLPPRFFHNGSDVDAPDGHYTWRNHWALVQHQLGQLRAALAVARALGRVLVLPRMACTCECFFYPGKNCVIEGHRVRLPHVCPTDHWLRPGRLQQAHREPGFLDNPRMPQSVVAATARARACERHEQGCGGGEGGGLLPGPLVLPRNSSDEQLRASLAPQAAARVLHLTGVAQLWGGFANPADAASFDDSLSNVLGSWCCLKEHPDGLVDPGVNVWKVPYAWTGHPKAVSDAADVGKCGA